MWQRAIVTLAQVALRGKSLPFLHLEDNTLVPGSARRMFTVEVFKQGDGVLPRDSRQFLEGRNGDSVALGLLVTGKLLLQLSQRLAVKNQLRRDAHQIFLSQENLQKFFCSLGFDG